MAPREVIAGARHLSRGDVLSSQNDEFPRSGIVIQSQARRGEPFNEGVDRYLAVDESRQVDRRLLQGHLGGTRPPGKDLGAQDAWSARSA